MKLLRIVTASIALLLCCNSLAEMRFVFHAPESSHDHRYKYHWEVLKTALELTTKKFGPYTLVPSEVFSENQQLIEMKKNSPKLTVMIRETNKVYEAELTSVKIPIDKNLIGYRVFLIEKNTQKELSSVKTLNQLLKFSVGQGEGWGDVSVLKHAGFNVVTEEKYNDLFKSLSNGKFKIFPRGVVEVLEEYRQFKSKYPNLTIEKHLLLYYPLPTYFWFHNSADGRLMARRVEEGLRLMIKTGAYLKIFDKHYAKVIRELGLEDRIKIQIPNPDLPNSVPFDRKELWYNTAD